jgi:hypothetical protein
VYKRNTKAKAWSLTQTIQPSSIVANDFFGTKVAMSDDAQYLSVTAAMVGEPKVWIYRLNKKTGTYTEIQTVMSPLGVGQQFGYQMAFSGAWVSGVWHTKGKVLQTNRRFLHPSLQATTASWPFLTTTAQTRSL